MSSILVYTPEATLEGNDKFGDIEAKFGEEMDIKEVTPTAGLYCMYMAILGAAKDKGLLQAEEVDDTIKKVINATANKRQMAIAAINHYKLPACICIDNGNGTADIDYNKNIVDESDTIFILERMGGFHYDWLKRRGAAPGVSAGGASLALRF